MSKNILYPNTNEFNELLNQKGILFVDFFAEWCGPCKMLAPEIEKLAENYADKVKIIKVDVDKEPALAAKYQVQSIPTLVIIKDGEAINKDLGYKPYPALSQMLDKVL